MSPDRYRPNLAYQLIILACCQSANTALNRAYNINFVWNSSPISTLTAAFVVLFMSFSNLFRLLSCTLHMIPLQPYISAVKYFLKVCKTVAVLQSFFVLTCCLCNALLQISVVQYFYFSKTKNLSAHLIKCSTIWAFNLSIRNVIIEFDVYIKRKIRVLFVGLQ